MKSKYLILIGLLLVGDVSANALLSIGKALVIYTNKSAVVVKNVAPAVKVVPKVVPKATNMVPYIPKVVPNTVPNVVPNSTIKNSVDDLPDIPNTSPLIIWNKIEDNRRKNTTK